MKLKIKAKVKIELTLDEADLLHSALHNLSSKEIGFNKAQLSDSEKAALEGFGMLLDSADGEY